MRLSGCSYRMTSSDVVDIVLSAALAGVFSLVGVYLGVWITDRNLRRSLLGRLRVELDENSGRAAQVEGLASVGKLIDPVPVPPMGHRAMDDAMAHRALLCFPQDLFFQLMIAASQVAQTNEALRLMRMFQMAGKDSDASMAQGWARAYASSYHQADQKLRSDVMNFSATRKERKRYGTGRLAETKFVTAGPVTIRTKTAKAPGSSSSALPPPKA
jgi:hypothetical protein